MPLVRRSRRSRCSAAERAHAAVRVVDAGVEQQVQEAREQRVADVPVHATASRPGWMSLMRSPITMSAPASQLREEARDLVEVVRQVGVGHQDVAPARRGEPGEVGAAVAAHRFVDRRGRPRAQPARRSRRSSRCRRRPPRRRSPPRAIASCAVGTHCSMLRASFRQGMTTETRHAGSLTSRTTALSTLVLMGRSGWQAGPRGSSARRRL